MANAYHHIGRRVDVINPYNVVCFVPVYNPLPPAFLVRMDVHLSITLHQFMVSEGLVPSPEETFKREAIIQKLKKTVQEWITKIAHLRKLPKQRRNLWINNASATILTYGSFGLGVHNSESDIDAICVGPRFATLEEDFFIVLYNMLKSSPEVSEIYCVKDAKVPLMRFKFEGISVDMPYAQLRVMSVPENVDLLNPMFVTSIDETSLKSLSGVCTNQRILQLVPNLENFQSLLRCIKFWAKQRGVYGNLFGFLGGIHWAILSAFVCQMSPDACLSALVMNFFNTFANWPWPTPVVLQDGMMHVVQDVTEKVNWMPIGLPCSPNQWCQSNVTLSTFNRIKKELFRGHEIAKGILRPDFDWDCLFEPYSLMYRHLYPQFLKIYLLACAKDELGEWAGWVKSRFPSLILKLEDINVSCDPNPTEHVDSGASVVFYWGLNVDQCTGVNVASLEKEFRNCLSSCYRGKPGKMLLSIVPASELPNIEQFFTRKMNGGKAFCGIPEYDQYRMPVYPPNNFVGYVAREGGHAGVLV
ncbi:nuclear poly(A) polymerase 3-like [Chenopodium quinoa]|uniref:nuclear poly(A) polymerase 3-like n=1 Tax=Chenopodium quinoa TaxID=63459 RepID=UPI000B7758FE|nr:nuclear poly(A) polymerase 3-like [Chenopodium quinoa]XP_021739909.1 nuclear poly(A) polymerase 3-like [Chenopodium quinoa]